MSPEAVLQHSETIRGIIIKEESIGIIKTLEASSAPIQIFVH